MRKILFSIIYLFFMLFCACSSKEQSNILDVVPPDFALVVEGNSSKCVLEKLELNGEMLGVINDFAFELKSMDSLVAIDGKLHQDFQNAQVACIKSLSNGELVSSFVFFFNKSLSNNDISNIIESNNLIYEKHQIRKASYISVPEIGSYWATHHHFLLYSRSEQLLVKLLAQSENSDKVYSNLDFKRVQNTLGQSVPVHLYINYEALESLFLSAVSTQYQGAVSEIFARFKGWAALDMQSNSEMLVTNGYSIATDSLSSLRPLKYQVPVHNSIVNVLPYNTKMMLHFGMSDYASFWEEFADKEQVDKMDNRFGVNIEQQLVSCLSEVSYCVFGTAENPVFVARMNDPATVMQMIEKLSANAGVTESIVVQGYTVKNLNVKNFVPDIFGKCFQNIKGCCYAIVDQYFVAANEFKTVQDVISGYRSGRTLDLSEGFKSFQNNLLGSDNVCLFWMDSEFQSALQLAASKDLVYTVFSMRKATEVKEESNAQWKVTLDAPITGKPHIVCDVKGRVYIVAFDVSNTMYLIDNDGNIVWKKRVSEPPMSTIEVVDFHRDGQVQMLFNTANYLEIIDFFGESMDGFPKRLRCEASNGLSVFDYDGNKTYRVMICGTDRFVYNYDLHGEETEGWNRHRTEDLVKQPVQHLVADNKDYIIVTDASGSIRILDRQGRIRIPLKSDLHKSQGVDFYENKTNHKGIILTSDDTGQLLYIANDGALARTDFGTYSDKHYFLYEDFNGDQDPDFIYLDGKQLRVFDRFKKLLWSHDFDVEISTKPVFYHLFRNKWLLGIVSENTKVLYLIDKSGNMSVSSGLISGMNFAIGSLKGNNEINLLTSEGNALFNYLIY